MHHENILEELYYGNINPYAKRFAQDSSYEAFMKIISDNEEKLTEFLEATEEEKHLFSQLMNAQSEVLELSQTERFIEGFRLGARFVSDTFLAPREGVLKGIG